MSGPGLGRGRRRWPGWVLAASSSSWALRRISCCRPASETPTCEDRGGRSGPGHEGRACAQHRAAQDCLLPDFWHLRLDMWRLTGPAIIAAERQGNQHCDSPGPASAGAGPTAGCQFTQSGGSHPGRTAAKWPHQTLSPSASRASSLNLGNVAHEVLLSPGVCVCLCHGTRQPQQSGRQHGPWAGRGSAM